MVLAKPTPCSHDSNHIEIETGRAENTKRPDILAISGDVWRRGWESNPRIKVLQTVQDVLHSVVAVGAEEQFNVLAS